MTHKICWNAAKTVGVIVDESNPDYLGLTYELRKGALNTLGVVSVDFVEAWGDMTADDNCTVEVVELMPSAPADVPPEKRTHVDGKRAFCDFPNCDCSMGAAERCKHPAL